MVSQVGAVRGALVALPQVMAEPPTIQRKLVGAAGGAIVPARKFDQTVSYPCPATESL